MNSVITAHGVSLTLPNGRELFKNLSFSVGRTRTALVGPNGVGKSTLAQLLIGDLEPTTGQIRRSAQVSFFAQREEPLDVSVADFIGAESRWSPLRETLLASIDPAERCVTLSGGQWMRVRLARALDSGFLILDEPTNDLDRDGRKALLQFLGEHDGGLLLISHDRECLSLCDDVLELSNRGLAKFGGTWKDYVSARDAERENLDRALVTAKRERDLARENRQALRDRQEKRNRRGVEMGSRGGIPKILLGARKRQAQATTGKIDDETMERAQRAVRLAHEALSEIKLNPAMYADLVGQPIPAGKLVAEAHDYNVHFDKWIYRSDLNFIWRGGIRLALKGENGSGKSTLVKAIRGETFETRGELRFGALRTLYIDQRCAELNDGKSILENIRDVSSASESEIRNGLAKFLFTKESVFQKVRDLSGGERLRAALARGFLALEKPELLILDEPTNNLDLTNVEFLENLTREFQGALVVISHDDVFLKNCGIDEAFHIGAARP